MQFQGARQFFSLPLRYTHIKEGIVSFPCLAFCSWSIRGRRVLTATRCIFYRGHILTHSFSRLQFHSMDCGGNVVSK